MKGFEVLGQALNGIEVVELYRQLDPRPDWVIMDHRMPLADGLTATRRIKAIDPEARIVFASADLTIVKEALEVGADAFLAKPFSVQELCQILEEPLRVVQVYVATALGLPVASVQKGEGSLDPDLFTSMLTAIDDFVSHSLSSLVPTRHYLSRMDYGPWSIGVHLAASFRLILVYTGYADQFLQMRLKQTVTAIEERYGRKLHNWDGDRQSVEGLEKLMEPLAG